MDKFPSIVDSISIVNKFPLTINFIPKDIPNINIEDANISNISIQKNAIYLTMKIIHIKIYNQFKIYSNNSKSILRIPWNIVYDICR